MPRRSDKECDDRRSEGECLMLTGRHNQMSFGLGSKAKRERLEPVEKLINMINHSLQAIGQHLSSN